MAGGVWAEGIDAIDRRLDDLEKSGFSSVATSIVDLGANEVADDRTCHGQAQLAARLVLQDVVERPAPRTVVAVPIDAQDNLFASSWEVRDVNELVVRWSCHRGGRYHAEPAQTSVSCVR